MNHKKTTEEFVNDAVKVHGDKYDYSRVVYVGSLEEITIVCKLHGPFLQACHVHLAGHGCPKCGKIKLLAGTSYFSRCLKCNKPLYYRNKQNYNKAKRLNVKCRSCMLRGKQRSKIHCDRLSIAKSLANLSQETRYKMRISTIAKIKRQGIVRGYNPVACAFIDQLNIMLGLKLQHACNGGEVELYGYYVDGYDKQNNVIFEYDEKSHRAPRNKIRDDVRQENLIREINPSLFLRYDDYNKKLYDTQTKSEIEICI